MEVGLALGGAFLSSALSVFFDRMTPKFPNLFKGRKADDQLLTKLKRTLFVIEVVLDDAEDKQNTNKHVKQWLEDLKSTVYDAEDLMDEINTEVLRMEIEGFEVEGSMTNMVTETLGPALHLSDEFLNEIIPKIEVVVDDLKHFETQIDVLGLGMGGTKKSASGRTPSTSLVDESVFCGRDDEKEKLIAMVLSDDTNGYNFSVIPIVGMGGIGKTTMAQIIYGDPRLTDFKKRAWVCVSENYDAFKITKNLVDQVHDSGSEERDDFNSLQVKLKESLAKKKFLIVIDDMWNYNYNDWDTLKAPLKYGEQGSKILLTTRDETVARMVKSELDIQYLKSISDEDSWSLFKKHAFDNGGPHSSPELEKIGKQMVLKCKGLPLAVKTIGGLLRSKTEVKEWQDISTSHFWNSENNPNDVLPVLGLSYHHLPPHLKHCFGFCAIFPKNYRMEERELVLLWMANDLLQHPTQKDKTLEDMGHEYIDELRSRSLLQKASDGSYIMHDLVNDLARGVSKTLCYRNDCDYPSGRIPCETRHFSYISGFFNDYKGFKVLGQANSLRTFVQLNLSSNFYVKFVTKIFSSDILPKLKCLRVLCLNGYLIKEVPDSVCNLKHLRYINLSWTLIKQLPDAICNLHNLQTLKLNSCQDLNKLPLQLTKLVNLRHLELIETKLTEMPIHMGRLKSLQTLSCFIVGRSPGRGIEELGKLHLHGYLLIKGLQNVISCNDATKANLENKKELQDLILEWSGTTDDSQLDWSVLDKLQPHTSLKSLTIDGYGGTIFADWVAHKSYCNIVSMSLINCKNCFSLPGLGHLSFMKSLTLAGLDNITTFCQELHGDASLTKPFQSLTSLRIKQMSNWKEWYTSGNVDFSRLEELYIEDCPKLIGKLPSQLLSLTKFEISGCPDLVLPNDWTSTCEDAQDDVQFHLSSLQFLSVSDMPNLKELPGWFLVLGGLKELTLRRWDSLVIVPKLMTSLTTLIVKDCTSLMSLPTIVENLVVSNCTKLEFPISKPSENCNTSLENLQVDNAGDSLNDILLCLHTEIVTLRVSGFECLKVFPSIQNFKLLSALKISRCFNMLSFPKGGLPVPNLQFFHISKCKKLKSLPERMHSLNPSLRDLWITDCPEIESFPEGGLPISLKSLISENCQINWCQHKLPALTNLHIHGGYYEDSFPEESMLPNSLLNLTISSCSNLKKLNENGLLHLTSLQNLAITNCPELMSLPEEGLLSLTSLSVLWVNNCPLLKAHLEREKGKYWHKIAHIRYITVDDQFIS